MTLHCMIDLETWGKGPTAQISSIGAVKFDPLDPEGPFDNFHVAIDPSLGSKAFRALFEVDPGTVMWWMSKERTVAREHWLSCEKLDLPSALVGFEEWFGPDSMPTWGNGATFDNVILLHAIAACGFERPWGYRDDRCYRTLRAEWPEVPWLSEREAAELLVSAPVNGIEGAAGVPHTALYDAQVQALHMRRIYAAKATGVLTNLSGPVGARKTSVLEAAAAMWGKPDVAQPSSGTDELQPDVAQPALSMLSDAELETEIDDLEARLDMAGELDAKGAARLKALDRERDRRRRDPLGILNDTHQEHRAVMNAVTGDGTED